jgi:ribonucleotide reductase beta subunit family protein with ferritin-like domain
MSTESFINTFNDACHILDNIRREEKPDFFKTIDQKPRSVQWKGTSSGILNKWPFDFKISWDYFLRHSGVPWGPNEIDPGLDDESYHRFSPELKDIFMQVFALLAFGDNIITSTMDNLQTMPFYNSTKLFFTDQGNRENVHEICYTRMLDLYGPKKHLYMDQKFMDKFKINLDVQSLFADMEIQAQMEHTLLFIQLNERLLFAIPFLLFHQLGECGMLINCVNINQLVMRDENLHYLHARDVLLATRSNKYNQSLVDFAKQFYIKTRGCMQNLLLPLPPKVQDVCMYYFDFVTYSLLLENQLVEDVDNGYKVNLFPTLIKNELPERTNLMESNSIQYNPIITTTTLYTNLL